MGDGAEAEKDSIKLYKSYKKEQATMFVNELNKLMLENAEEDNNEED